MLFDAQANLIHRLSYPHQQYYPKEGFVEHDAEEIFANTLKSMVEILKLKNLKASDIAAVSITNQRETSLIWDKATGKPIANAAVWQCQRGTEYCNQLKAEGKEALVREKTGMIIDPYFTASKLR